MSQFTIAWLVKQYAEDDWTVELSEPSYCHDKQQVVIFHNEPLEPVP